MHAVDEERRAAQSVCAYAHPSNVKLLKVDRPIHNPPNQSNNESETKNQATKKIFTAPSKKQNVITTSLKPALIVASSRISCFALFIQRRLSRVVIRASDNALRRCMNSLLSRRRTNPQSDKPHTDSGSRTSSSAAFARQRAVVRRRCFIAAAVILVLTLAIAPLSRTWIGTSSLRQVLTNPPMPVDGKTGLFACGVPALKLNDEFCDCPLDGSDERNTSACAGLVVERPDAMFRCKTAVFFPSSEARQMDVGVHLSKVNDGVFDCCDGTDEPKILAQNIVVVVMNGC